MAKTETDTTRLTVEALTRAIGSPLRWRILAELSTHEPLMVSELSNSLGHTMSNISKHIAVLIETGAVEQIRGRMYAVRARFQASPGVLDFGYGPFHMKPTRTTTDNPEAPNPRPQTS